jgi:hypothetical protein
MKQTPKTAKKKAGRPVKVIEIDSKSLVEELASLQCTLEEIASVLGVNKSTVSRNYATEIDKGRQNGRISLRRNQFNLSKTNAAVAIWLGKNWLGQSDNPTGDNTEENNGLTEYLKGFRSAILT